MNPTGERLLADHIGYTAIEHLHRYAIAMEYVENKVVLDIASGEGYGSNLMALKSKEVVGVDISSEAINHANQKYTLSNLVFKLGSADKIPCPDNYFDVVVSFETIEHHDKHTEMMSEIKRVLKPEGVLIISSPDKLHYSDIPQFNNQFHVKELYESEFKGLINQYFKNNIFLKQRLDYFSVIIPDQQYVEFECYEGTFKGINKKNDYGPHYIISISSDNELNQRRIIPLFYGWDVLQKDFNSQLESTSFSYRNSYRYKLGHFLLYPLLLLREILNKLNN